MVPSIVRGLPLPAQLASLIDRGRRRHPGHAALAKVIPWFDDSLAFVGDPEQMMFASQTLDRLADDPHSTYFSVDRGSRAATPLELP